MLGRQAQPLGDDGAMAVMRLALVAEQAAAPPGRKFAQHLELVGCFRHFQMGFEDPPEIVVSSASGSQTTVGRRAQRTKVQIFDVDRGDAGLQRVLGEAGAAGGRNGADIHEDLDRGDPQDVQDVTLGQTFIADSEERR
jgi:hypothetical protein